jgi:hypothetical protein
VVREGLRLSLGWLKPPVPRSSDVTVVLAILLEYGEETPPSPGPGVGGGSPRRVSGERESSLADPHGGPAATEDDYDSVYSIVGMPLTFKRAIFGIS